MNFPPLSFTTRHKSRARVLRSQTKISQAFNPGNTTTRPPSTIFMAIWDTGATNTAISKNVIQTCNLKPIGITEVNTCGGIRRAEQYLINIVLRNNVGLSELLVTEAEIHGADVLIGMDIISLGDFAVTHPDSKTCLSFRLPSVADIDFVAETNKAKEQPQQPVRLEEVKPARNSRCPCGSGKKYKKCCGQ